jgi:hypothetical protein
MFAAQGLSGLSHRNLDARCSSPGSLTCHAKARVYRTPDARPKLDAPSFVRSAPVTSHQSLCTFILSTSEIKLNSLLQF